MPCRAHHVCVLIALISLAVAPSALFARTWDVYPDGRTGLSSIQAAVDMAVDSDVIVVHPGTYTGRGNNDINLQRQALTIRSTDPTDPAVVEATILDCQGSDTDPHRAFYVSDFNGKIAGLTMINGRADTGGAVYCEDSNLILDHCRILDNATLPGDLKDDPDGGPGGGLYCFGSVVEIADCLISGNATGAGVESRGASGGSGGDGGGVYAADSVVYVADCTIADNTTGDGGDSDVLPGRGGDGGGLCCDSLVLAGTSVLRNTCGRGGDGYTAQGGGNGGGLYCKRATIERCTIEGNTTGAGGDSADTGWSAAGHGGHGAGVYCEDSLDVFDSLIAGNRTGQGGSALSTYLDGDDGSGAGLWCALGLIDHCTIVSNAVADQRASASTFGTGPGAGILCSNLTVVSNTILWDNMPDQLAGHNCSNVLYCDIEGSTCLFNTGNIASDPLFVQPGNWVDAADPSIIVTSGEPGAVWASGDYQLLDASPCADAADPEALRDPERTDLQGIPRFSGAAADMGAYEIQGLVPLYRFVSPTTGKYFYTPRESEKDKLVTQQSHLWTFQGVAYHVYLRAADASLMPVYRFWSDALGSHLWTIDESEYDRLTTQQSYLWTYEGIAFYAYPPGKQPAGAKPVYRFGSSRLNAQFFTADDDERRLFVSTMSHTWVYEEIAWYTFDSDGGSDTPDTPDTAGIYEFSGGRDSASFALEIKAYLDGQLAQLDTTNVSFTPATGRMQMAVDLAGLTTELNGFHVESELLQHDGIATETTGKFSLPFSMVLYGFFDSAVARGPYGIDPRALTFPAAGQQGSVAAGETFSIIGAAVVEGTKFEVDLDLSPTEFTLSGLATFANSAETGRLDVTMNGPFQWNRSRQEDLLLEADVRGHVLQLYVTDAQIRSTGLWLGKRVPEAKDEGK